MKYDPIEMQALVLFKENTFLEIKTFRAAIKIGPTGGGDLPDNVRILDRAIQMYRTYMEYKLSQAANEKG